jgi:hypothetical protein
MDVPALRSSPLAYIRVAAVVYLRNLRRVASLQSTKPAQQSHNNKHGHKIAQSQNDVDAIE